MKFIITLIALSSISNLSAANKCSGRFTPFEMMKVGVDKKWITLIGVTETRECESVYGKLNCGEWSINHNLTPHFKKLDLKLESILQTVIAKGTHFKDTRGYFNWKERSTTMSLNLKRKVSGRGSCRQWGASGGVGYGGCRSWSTVTHTIDMGTFKGRVSEDCAYLYGPTTKTEPTYFSENTFAFIEKRKILKNK